MTPTPTTYLNVPTFGTGAAVTQPVAGTYSGGFLPGQLFPAEYENWLMNRLTANSNVSETSVLSMNAELVYILTQASISPNAGSTVQLYAALNALYATVGALATEASTRSSADTTLQSNINAESTNRANADALLAPIASPTFTGTVVVPTAVGATSPVQKSVTDSLQSQITAGSLLSVENFTANLTGGAFIDQISAMAVGEMRFVNTNRLTTGSPSTYALKLPAAGTFTYQILGGINFGSNSTTCASASGAAAGATINTDPGSVSSGFRFQYSVIVKRTA